MKVSDLKNAWRKGIRPEFLFFWSEARQDDKVGREVLCQWWSAPIRIGDEDYPTTEHFMMAEKARTFGDLESLELIRSTPHPGVAKGIGRQVRNFDTATWDLHRYGVVVAANMAKFTQNPEMGEYLISTGNKVIVEASGEDPVWGVGLWEHEPKINNPLEWKGRNLLGFALMEVRDYIGHGHAGHCHTLPCAVQGGY